ATGQADAEVRITARGGPGESAALAYIKSMASPWTRPAKRLSSDTVPVTAAAGAPVEAVAVAAGGGRRRSELSSAMLLSMMRASGESAGSAARSFFHQLSASA